MQRIRNYMLIVLLACAGCLPYSVEPLSDDTNSVVPEGLIGDWYSVTDNEGHECSIALKPNTSATLQVTMSGKPEDFFVASEEDSLFVSFPHPPENEASKTIKGYAWAKMTKTKDGFSIQGLSLDEVKKDIRSGKIKGTIPSGKFLFSRESPRIEADRATVLKYLRERGDQSYDPELIFTLTQTKPENKSKPRQAAKAK